MWTSLPTALMALLLLSDSAAARKRKSTVTISACKATASSTSIPSIAAASVSSGVLLENSDGEVYGSEAVAGTVTVQPVPVGTADGVVYSGVATGTGIPSGIFFTGYGSGTAGPTGSGHHTGIFHTGHGSGAPHPTHSRNSTRGFKHSHTAVLSSTDGNVAYSTAVTSTTRLYTTVTPASSTAAFSSSQAAATTSAQTSSTLVTVPSAKPSSTTQPASSSAQLSTTASAAPSSTTVPFLRGVNLGGWLVLEKWMDSDAFTGAFASAVDQWTFDSTTGAQAALETHWSTFFTEDDIKTIAATGINALRIPIGFWAYDNANTNYISGADAYLEKAIGWARNAGMKVWVDCHGSPGSQNGFDNSGQEGSVNWQQTANLERSISVLKIMAAKYGAMEYADVVVGLEMTNEPISYGNNKFSVTQSWAQEAYAAVKNVTANPNMVIVMHDAFQGAGQWTGVANTLINGGAKTFGIDSHLYQLFSDSDNALTQAQHITEACGWASGLKSANEVMPTYVGEWSAATNICVNPDGSTTAGTSCSVSGCQCQSASFDSWNSNMVEQVRKFVEAQLDVFESSTIS
ncbi:hypothetical protein G7Y89_g9410 [Cudoniella acicularis]|uniref:glucan 1,3-beta-glucosidase n=1 Tax=Cudoniella acicularis TaxID=354080 RepID=A0A8H4W048_9HELO|nr:hypothetical protein G7Y89_g9410 [Cudoniella acicularis]